MKESILVALVVIGLGVPAQAEEWEGWEPKRSLPTQAEETLTEQAVVLIPPVSIERESYGVERWRPLVSQFEGWDVNRMLRIMWCESRGVPTAENPRSTATGLFQIMASIWYPNGPRSDLWDPELNVATAHYVWQQQGYRAWVCKG